ncbi:MAG: Flp pilus assembly complex ATPase component TadA [Candidatus Omnitrophica bacterium]|nr:Flp pilus assembly complex ATPase component TadA [Candidatus Omnitrophota bacterium]
MERHYSRELKQRTKMISDSIQIGELLVKKNIITTEQLNSALAKQKKSNLRIGEELVKSGVVKEEILLITMAESMNIEFIKISTIDISQNIIEKIPARFVTHYNFFPLFEKNGVLHIAVSDPLDFYTQDEIKLLIRKPINVCLATSVEINEAIKRYYGVGAKTMAQMVDDSPHLEIISHKSESRSEEKSEETQDPSVIKFIDQIIQQAVRERATDIHIEPYENSLRVRYRIDGLLYDVPAPSSIHHFQSAIIIRIKIMAELDISEKRLPQDGRIQVRIDNDDYDLRISILPSAFGECVEVRILSRKQVFLSLEELGLDKEGLALINVLIKRPHGIMLVTGPTGSGKTTTLYSCLNRINSAERKIITIEDPIEYRLHGITQIQVMPKIELTFANGLRSMLRHDPDVMMVGEIRDLETAELAIRTALTGHLVFSTLHTNDSSGAVTRLLDMGIEPYLVSSSVNCIIAQRLIRVICPNCKETFVPHEEILKEFGVHKELFISSSFFRGRGCESCKFTGYLGRTAIFEILNVSDAIKEMILNRTPSNIIKQKAISLGLKTLRLCGWEKVLQGITTPEEVIRVSQEDTFDP